MNIQDLEYSDHDFWDYIMDEHEAELKALVVNRSLTNDAVEEWASQYEQLLRDEERERGDQDWQYLQDRF